MNEEERLIYRLMGVPGIGAGAMRRVLTGWGDDGNAVGKFWEQTIEAYRSQWRLPAKAARFLWEAAKSDTLWCGAERDADEAEAAQIELLSILDGDYAALAARRGLPAVLFTRGNQDLIWSSGTAIVQSQGASEEALEWGARLAAGLAAAGCALITGHNRDGYQRSAAAATRAGTPLVIALDRPLHGQTAAGPRAVPVSTARIWDVQFHPERELLLSGAGPGEAWTPAHARRRDALVIGLAGQVVAGAVRPAGTMADLCARAASTGRPVFRSPFCLADFQATTLPREIEAALKVVARSEAGSREGAAACQARPSGPQPGWLARRWQKETAAFATSLQEWVGSSGWVECGNAKAAASSTKLRTGIVAIVFVPALGDDQEVVIVGRSAGREGARSDDAESAMVLSPPAPITELEALRAYLARCRARLEGVLSFSRSSTW